MHLTGRGGGGSGSGNDSEEEKKEKEKYCKQLGFISGLLQGVLAGAPITGTASTGYSLGQISAGLVQAAISSAYRDIDWYSQTGDHAPVNYSSGILNWYQASINWPLNSWSGLGGGYPPTLANGGLEHIFATWALSVGLGNGTSVLTDPDPSTACP